MVQEDRISCPRCTKPVIVRVPQVHVVNMDDTSIAVMHHATYHCDSCGLWLTAIIKNVNAALEWIPVKPPEDNKIIVMPGNII